MFPFGKKDENQDDTPKPSRRRLLWYGFGLATGIFGRPIYDAFYPHVLDDAGETASGRINRWLDSGHRENVEQFLTAHNTHRDRINKLFDTQLSDQDSVKLATTIRLLELHIALRSQMAKYANSEWSRLFFRSINRTPDVVSGTINTLGRIYDFGANKIRELNHEKEIPETPEPQPAMIRDPISTQVALAADILLSDSNGPRSLFDSLAKKIRGTRGIYKSGDKFEMGVLGEALFQIAKLRPLYVRLLRSIPSDDGKEEFALEQAETQLLNASALLQKEGSLDQVRKILAKTYFYDPTKSLTADDARGVYIANLITPISRALILNITGPESGWDGQEVSSTGATGYFQFTETTWLGMLKRDGHKVSHQLGAAIDVLNGPNDALLRNEVIKIKQQLDGIVDEAVPDDQKLALRTNSALNIILGTYYANENIESFKREFANNPQALDIVNTPEFIRIANVSGSEGAKALARAGLHADATSILIKKGYQRVVTPNRDFFAGSLQEVMDRVTVSLLTPEGADLVLDLATNGGLAKLGITHHHAPSKKAGVKSNHKAPTHPPKKVQPARHAAPAY